MGNLLKISSLFAFDDEDNRGGYDTRSGADSNADPKANADVDVKINFFYLWRSL